MDSVRVNRVGTKYVSRQDGSLLYECQYCEVWFEPKAKFKQKYCSESCRVMACRERKNGMAGTYALKRNSTSNADMLRQLKQIRSETADLLLKTTDRAFDSLLDRQHDIDLRMAEEIRKMRSDLNKRMDWLMLIAAIAPVVSPAVVSWFKEVAMGEKPPIDQIKDQISEISDKLDEKTKADLRRMMEDRDLKDLADSML